MSGSALGFICHVERYLLLAKARDKLAKTTCYVLKLAVLYMERHEGSPALQFLFAKLAKEIGKARKVFRLFKTLHDWGGLIEKWPKLDATHKALRLTNTVCSSITDTLQGDAVWFLKLIGVWGAMSKRRRAQVMFWTNWSWMVNAVLDIVLHREAMASGEAAVVKARLATKGADASAVLAAAEAKRTTNMLGLTVMLSDLGGAIMAVGDLEVSPYAETFSLVGGSVDVVKYWRKTS